MKLVLHTVSTAARELDKSEGTIRYWSKTGKLRTFRTPSGLRLFLASDIEELKRERGQ
jgi:DNA-binding transcriptional MerR regulator